VQSTRQVWALPLSLAATYGIQLMYLFLRVLRCFSSPGSLPHLWRGYPDLHRDGFPHSETAGSQDVGSLPATIAVNCVLFRLLLPRHSLFAFFFDKNPSLPRTVKRLCGVSSLHLSRCPSAASQLQGKLSVVKELALRNEVTNRWT